MKFSSKDAVISWLSGLILRDGVSLGSIGLVIDHARDSLERLGADSEAYTLEVVGCEGDNLTKIARLMMVLVDEFGCSELKAMFEEMVEIRKDFKLALMTDDDDDLVV